MQWTKSFCFGFELFVETVPQFFHNASIWLTLVLAVQRYVYICKATTMRHLCTNPRSKKIVVAIIILSMISISPRFFDRDYSIEGWENTVMKEIILVYIIERCEKWKIRNCRGVVQHLFSTCRPLEED